MKKILTTINDSLMDKMNECALQNIKGGTAGTNEAEGHWEYFYLDGKLYRRWVDKQGNIIKIEPM